MNQVWTPEGLTTRWTLLILTGILLFVLAGCAVPPEEFLLPTRTPTGASSQAADASSTSADTTVITDTTSSTPSAEVADVQTATPNPLTELRQQADGYWVYTDYEAGYRFWMSDNYHLEDVANLEFTEIVMRSQEVRDELGIEQASALLLDPEGMRVMGIYLDETIAEYLSTGFSVTYIEDPVWAEMSLEEAHQSLINLFASGYGMAPNQMETDLIETPTGMRYGVIVYKVALTYYHLRVVFELPDGIGLMTFGFADENVRAFGPEFQVATSSLELLETD